MTTQQILKASELKNPHGLSKDHINCIVRHFGRLAKLDQQAAARTVRYIIDGTDEDVLLTVGGMKEAARALCLTGIPHSSPQDYGDARAALKERAPMLRPDAKAPPGLWVRIGQVFAAARHAASQQVQAPPGAPDWLAALIREIHQAWLADERRGADRPTWDLSELEAAVEIAALPTDLIGRTFLNEASAQALRGGGYYYYGMSAVDPFSGGGRYLARHLGMVRETLAATGADHRLHVLRTLVQLKFDFAPVVDQVVGYAVGPQKTVRDAALPLLSPCRDQARPHIDRVLAEGDAAQRHEAALLLWRLFGHDAAAPLQEHASRETSDRVKQTIQKLLAAPAEASDEVVRLLAESLPPVQIDLGVIDLPEEAKKGLREVFAKAWQQAQKHYEQAMERWNAPNRPKWMSQPSEPARPTETAVEGLVRYVEGKAEDFASTYIQPPYVPNPYTQPGRKAEKFESAVLLLRRYAGLLGTLGDWLAPPEVKLIHIARLAAALGRLAFTAHNNALNLWWRNHQDLEAYRRRCPEPFGLRDLDAVVASLPGGQPGLVASAYLARGRYNAFCDWEPEAVWPLFAEQPEVLHEVLHPGKAAAKDYSRSQNRENAFKVLAMFPTLPPGFIPLLWDIALGENKSERQLAQAALASAPDKAAKVVIALADGRQAVRAAAAEWLGKIGDPAAVEPLKEAVRKERQESVKGVIMAALEALGADVREFLDRDAHLAEANAGLAKKQPAGMDWFPLDSLPALHWEDTGEAVDPAIPKWWVVQGVQQKSPVCGPVLRRYLGMCRKGEAAGLARFVLSAWMGHDTRVPAQEAAAEKARQEADKMWARYSQNQYWVNHYQNNKDNLYRQLFQGYSTAFVGSAVGQKGMLAIVAAAGDGDCVKLCEQYIRKWFGNRLAQCKALVEVLAWIKHPLAIQVLLSLGIRFRTKAVRKAAADHVQALADREGWTIDELADRTIPDAGFERPTDENGAPVGDEAALTLDYGPRKFTVRLDDDLEPVVTNEEGKKLKNAPAAGKQDDADKAKAARKAFAGAKKMVKEVVKRQTERLYEALCTQRTWRFEDWRRYLAGHPIAGRLCVRVAWAAFDGERFLGCFRPLEDGSLTNEKDEEVRLDAGALVRLAHPCNTPAELGAAWVKHLEDYDVEPLFPQFGRDTYTLPEAKKSEAEVNDFEGHQVTTFRLRGKATKLGYVRGEAEDGGWFHLYRKPFPSLGVQAVIEFTGNSLPEEDRAAALQSLYFTAVKSDDESAYAWQPGKLPLGNVPPVLLSECRNDLKQMAGEGTGYDPKWREKSYY
jgi:hypothetical protein